MENSTTHTENVNKFIKHIDMTWISSFLKNLKICIIGEPQYQIWLEESVQIILTNEEIFNQVIVEIAKGSTTSYNNQGNLASNLFLVAIICCEIAHQIFGIEPSLEAFQIGFFHGIGKPFACHTFKKGDETITSYNGHNKIGSKLCQHLGLNETIQYCVNEQHIQCDDEVWNALQILSCPRQKPDELSLEALSFEDLSNKSSLDNKLKYLAILMAAKSLAYEEPSFEEDILDHPKVRMGEMIFVELLRFTKAMNTTGNPVGTALEIITTYRPPPGKVIITMHGHSGFGKSTYTDIFKKIFTKNGITVNHVERDYSLYKVYSGLTNIPLDTLTSEMYKEIWNFINVIEKKGSVVQEQWISDLCEALTSGAQVIIIDTVQTAYNQGWNNTLATLKQENKNAYDVWLPSLKLVYNGFPASTLGHEYDPKIGSYQLLPRVDDSYYSYPELNTEVKAEAFNPEKNDAGYGTFEPIINIVLNIFS